MSDSALLDGLTAETIDGEYLYFAVAVAVAVAIPIDPSVAAALEAHFAIAGAAVASQASGRHYLNFAERPTDPASFYGEETYARLRRVRARVDPLELSAATTRSPRPRPLRRSAPGVTVAPSRRPSAPNHWLPPSAGGGADGTHRRDRRRDLPDLHDHAK